MRAVLLFVTLLVSQVYSAPQFISFKEGKLGVNFGGYHAGVGLGGLLGGGAGGGLFAEAGTPHGQSARAGLGGNVDQNGEVAGRLFAGATAGHNVGAAAGLGGKVAGGGAGGLGFATAEGGIHQAAAGLVGETNVHGSAGIKYSGTKSIAVPTTVIKETEISVVPVETVQHKKIHKEINVDALNEIAAAGVESNVEANINLNANPQPTVIVKEVHVQPQTHVIEKHIVHTHTKPHHHDHTAFFGGFIGAGVEAGSPPVSVYKTVEPSIQKRIDVGAQSAANFGAAAETSAIGGGQVSYKKEVSVSQNPTFFQDIFNIPISTLKAVGSFLSNTAGNTNVSVQKSATIQTDSDTISPKHASPISSSSSSEAHISVETPSASQLIDGIFAIPINTLGAVNKFLENNIPLRKRIQVTQGESEEPKRVRLGPHARRRANKRILVLEEANNNE